MDNCAEETTNEPKVAQALKNFHEIKKRRALAKLEPKNMISEDSEGEACGTSFKTPAHKKKTGAELTATTVSVSSILRTGPRTGKKGSISFAPQKTYGVPELDEIPAEYDDYGREVPKEILYARQMQAERRLQPTTAKKTTTVIKKPRRLNLSAPKASSTLCKEFEDIPAQYDASGKEIPKEILYAKQMRAEKDLRDAAEAAAARERGGPSPSRPRSTPAGPSKGRMTPMTPRGKVCPQPGKSAKPALSKHLQMAAKTNDPYEKEILHQLHHLDESLNRRLRKMEERLFPPDVLEKLSKLDAQKRYENLETAEMEREAKEWGELQDEIEDSLLPPEELYSLTGKLHRTALKNQSEKLQTVIDKIETAAADITEKLYDEEEPLKIKRILPTPKLKEPQEAAPSKDITSKYKTPARKPPAKIPKSAPSKIVPPTPSTPPRTRPPRVTYRTVQVPKKPEPERDDLAVRTTSKTVRKYFGRTREKMGDDYWDGIFENETQATDGDDEGGECEDAPMEFDEGEPEITQLTFAEINDSLEKTKRIIQDTPVLKEIILTDDYFPGFMDDAINAQLDFYKIKDLENTEAVTLVKAFDLRVKQEQENIHKNINSGETEREFFFQSKDAADDFNDFPQALRDEILQSGIMAVDLQSCMRGPTTNFLDAIDCLTKAELLCRYDAAMKGVDKAREETEKQSSFIADITEESFEFDEDETFRPIEIISYVGVTQPAN